MRDNTCTLFCRSMCGIRIVGLRKRIHHQTLIIVRDQVEIISGIKSQVLQIIGSFPPVDTTFGSKSRLVACIVSYIEYFYFTGPIWNRLYSLPWHPDMNSGVMNCNYSPVCRWWRVLEPEHLLHLCLHDIGTSTIHHGYPKRFVHRHSGGDCRFACRHK